MNFGMLLGMRSGMQSSSDSFTPHFPITPAEIATAIGAGASWREILTFQEASGNLTTLDTARAATAAGTAPPTYTIDYAQSGPTAGHSSIKLGGSGGFTTSRFVFANAAVEPGTNSFAAMLTFNVPSTPAGTYTMMGIETGADYWRVRMNTSGHILFQIFDGSVSTLLTLAHNHTGSFFNVLVSFDSSTDTLELTSRLGTASSTGIALGAINSASRGLAIGSTQSPINSWGYFAYTQDITGLQTSPSTLIGNFETYTGQV